MSQELELVLIDKGLLAAVLLFFGFYLKQLSENYRLKKVYAQMLAEMRISAYQEIVLKASAYERSISSYLEIVKGYSLEQIEQSLLQDEFLVMKKSFEEFRLTTDRFQILISDNLLSKCSNFISLSAEIIKSIDFKDFDQKSIAQLQEQTRKAKIEVISLAKSEVHKPKF